MAITSIIWFEFMIERLNKRGTLYLLSAMRSKAESDIRRYGHKSAVKGGGFIGKEAYESALYFMKEELPIIQEIVGDTFKEL
jgi:hypothetical protein